MPDYNYGKWVGGRFEKRFNRAIFDIFIGLLVNPILAGAVRKEPQKMIEAFKSLCNNDTKFIEAIERTTKSLDSTRHRFAALAAELGSVYGISVTVPSIQA